MTYNEQLYDLYKKHWEGLVHSINKLPVNEWPTHPLLLQLPNENQYEKADIKIMFVGQETNDWENTFGSYSITELQSTYSDFMTSDSSKNSPFWSFIKNWMHSIKEANPESSLSMVWNNIHKLGRVEDTGAPSSTIQDIAYKDFEIFEKELEVLKPNMVVFFTSHRYDNALEKHLPGIKFFPLKDYSENQIVLCSHPSLPSTSIRTYHPGYLNRLKPGKHEFHRETPKEALLHQWSIASSEKEQYKFHNYGI